MSADPADSDRIRRLRAARASGRIPGDLIDWLCRRAGVDGPIPDDGLTPFARVALALSAEIDRWMAARGVTHRTISCPRRSLARVLRGDDVLVSTVADVADALGCDIGVRFIPRGATDGAKRTTGGASAGAPSPSPRTLEADTRPAGCTSAAPASVRR